MTTGQARVDCSLLSCGIAGCERLPCDVNWKEIQGVIVPMSFRTHYLYKSEATQEVDITEGYDRAIEWSQVNEPIDPEVFTPEGISESRSAMAAHMRLGQIVVERVHPQPLPVITPKAIEPLAPKSDSRRNWLIWGNLVLFGIAIWIFRRQRKKS